VSTPQALPQILAEAVAHHHSLRSASVTTRAELGRTALDASVVSGVRAAAFDHRISLQKLEVLCLVVELGGVGKAAEHIGVAQPVVTEHLRTLQDRIGARLLLREGRQLRLTEAGDAVYAWARLVVARSHEVAREIESLAQGTAGRAVVAASMTVGSYLLPPILSRFRRARPSAQIELYVSDPERVVSSTEIGTADFSVVMTDSALDPAVFAVEQLGAHSLLLVASATDDRVGGTIRAQDLARLPFVCSLSGFARRRFEDMHLQRLGITTRDVVIELGHAEAMKCAVEEGLGVALLFRSSVERELGFGLLREVRIEGVELDVPIQLIRRTDMQLSPLQAQLLDEIRRGLGAAETRAP
jgi:LysR family transcriptional regulator, low CO2-responsive transcriptional regulator